MIWNDRIREGDEEEITMNINQRQKGDISNKIRLDNLEFDFNNKATTASYCCKREEDIRREEKRDRMKEEEGQKGRRGRETIIPEGKAMLRGIQN